MSQTKPGKPILYRSRGGTGLRASESRVQDRDLRGRLERLLDRLGNNGLADLMSVSRSQPSRWRSGEESMSSESLRRLLDVDYVLSRLLQLYPAEQAMIWLHSHNAHLGARPADVLRVRGANAVIPAIDAESEGAYA